MNSPAEHSHVVTASLVPEESRLFVLPRFFGLKLSRAELGVYGWMERLSADYDGGYWHYYVLSNGGFYMAPAADKRYRVMVPGNQFEGELSGDAAGIVAVLNMLCQLSHEGVGRCAELYHQLHEFAYFHPEAAKILAAID